MAQIEILHRFTRAVLFAGEYEDQKAAVVAATKSGADLSGAYLSGANLSGAYLSGADLSGADLSRANLSGADLSGADLSGADLSGAYLSRANLSRAYLSGAYLSGADLSGADLSGADLSGAYLSRANLSGANLSGAYLSGADLSGADLSRANLSGATGINPHRVCDLALLLAQPGAIRLYKLVTHDLKSPMQVDSKLRMTYAVGATVEVQGANTDRDVECGAGVNVATLPWCLSKFDEAQRGDKAGRILIVEFTAADIASIPTATDGKVRLHRCAVVGEVDLTPIFALDATPKPAEAAPHVS